MMQRGRRKSSRSNSSGRESALTGGHGAAGRGKVRVASDRYTTFPLCSLCPSRTRREGKPLFVTPAVDRGGNGGSVLRHRVPPRIEYWIGVAQPRCCDRRTRPAKQQETGRIDACTRAALDRILTYLRSLSPSLSFSTGISALAVPASGYALVGARSSANKAKMKKSMPLRTRSCAHHPRRPINLSGKSRKVQLNVPFY